MAKKKAAKKANPQDLTLRNNRKTRKDIQTLTATVSEMAVGLTRLTLRVYALENAANKPAGDGQ